MQRKLIDTDALDHVASVIRQECIEVGGRITIVRTPTGEVVNGVVRFLTGVDIVTCCQPSVVVSTADEVDDDLATERREVEINLKDTLGLTSEPETCFIWDGHICVAFRSNANVYALYFE